MENLNHMVTRTHIEAAKSALVMTPDLGRGYVAPAFESDPEAVGDLMTALRDHERAEMVRLLYRARVTPAAFRVALEFAWTQTHHYTDVLRAARTWPQFVRWCRYAAFPLPADVPDPVTIYRGGSEPDRNGIWWQVTHPEFGQAVLKRVFESVEDIAKMEAHPKLEGRNMIMVLAPK